MLQSSLLCRGEREESGILRYLKTSTCCAFPKQGELVGGFDCLQVIGHSTLTKECGVKLELKKQASKDLVSAYPPPAASCIGVRVGRNRSNVVGAPLSNPFVDCWSAGQRVLGSFPETTCLWLSLIGARARHFLLLIKSDK